MAKRGYHRQRHRKNRRARCHFCEEVSELMPLGWEGSTVHACRVCYGELVHGIIPRLEPVNFASRPEPVILADRQIGEV